MELRALGWRDFWFCLKLARDPFVRSMSMSESYPTLGEHWLWMSRWKTDPNRRCWVVMVGGKRIGIVNGIREGGALGDGAEVGVTLLARYRRLGYGQATIEDGTRLIWKTLAPHVRARIKGQNKASLKAFENAGYERLTYWAGIHTLISRMPS